MRVLHVTASMSLNRGGSTTAMRGLAAALARQGMHCEVVTAQGPDVGSDAPPIPGVKMHSFDTEFPAPFWTGYSRKLARFLDSEARNFDVVHAHQTMPYTTYAAFRAARKHALPYVLSLRGDLAAWALRHKRLRKWAYRKALLDNVMRSADALHSLSPVEATRAAELGYETPTFTIPNGVAVDDPSPSAASEFLKSHPTLAGRRIVLFLGRLHRIKGVDVLARGFSMAATRFPDAVLLIVGPDEGARALMESILAQAGVLDRAVFTGMLTGDRKQAALQCAELFVQTSHTEGFSNSVLEALAAGLPVVISEQCNFPEVVEHGAGFVVPLNDAAVCEAIGKLLSDPRLGARMGCNGRKLATERYSWRSAAAAMAACYRMLLRNDPRLRLFQAEFEAPAGVEAGRSSTISRSASRASRVARKSSAVWRT